MGVHILPGADRDRPRSGPQRLGLLGGLLGLFWLACALPLAAQTPEPQVPEALKPWIPWVLEGGPERVDRRACPLDAQGAARLCAWGGVLRLEFDEGGARFAQDWTLYAPDWVILPGDADTWPEEVQAKGQDIPVVSRQDRPAIYLPAGRHQLTGRLRWLRTPESLLVPPETALVDLVRSGEIIPARLDLDGRLWLTEPKTEVGAEDGLELRVYRLIEDDLPLRVQTRLELAVFGQPREIQLGPVLLMGGIPSALQSPLPARLTSEGGLRLQARPGQWSLRIDAHHPGRIHELQRPAQSAPWPAREVWAFAAHPERRRADVLGLERLDPQQAGVPLEWSRYPVYAADPGATLVLAEQPPGELPPDRLRLDRELWLDFDGRGLSLRDRLNGTLSRSWRLEVGPGLELGQARIDDQPRLITRLGPEAAAGIEVRGGELDLVADSRIETGRTWIPASGWTAVLDGATARLHLPPGWDLIAAFGSDNRPDTWLSRWTLLDLFVVLLIALGVGRLCGSGWGLLALAALILTWFEPGAPHWVWLHLLAAASLVRLLNAQPEGPGIRRWRVLAVWYRRFAFLALLVIGIPFLVSEVRDAIYPQLAQAEGAVYPASVMAKEGRGAGFGPSAPMPEMLDKSIMAPMPRLAPKPLERLDPRSLIQTGPGVPDWQWRSVEFRWTGPVGPEHGVRLWLLDPLGSLLWALLGSALVVLLGLRLADLVPSRRRMGVHGTLSVSLTLAALLIALGSFGLAPRTAWAEGFPSPELLDELQARLLRPPECLPQCLTLASLRISLKPDDLRLELTIDSAAAISAPLLDGRSNWLPSRVLIDSAEPQGIRRDREGRLLVPLAPGRHRIQLLGPLGSQERIDLALGLVPHRLEASAEGWRIEGLNPGGRPGAQFQLIRATGPDPETKAMGEEALPPLLLVERRLLLGLDWLVETQVHRLSAPDLPVLMPVPLIPGEAVQTPGVQVEGGQVWVALASGQTAFGWTSRLAPVDALTLTASSDARLTESWVLDLSPMWHLVGMDLSPLQPEGQERRWLPRWRPLPGERLNLRFSRPEAVPGPTLTLDRVEYRVEPGQRGTAYTLGLLARSSQGGDHRLHLPQGSSLRALKIDGRPLPLPDLQDGQLRLPIAPGTQRVEVAWHLGQPLDPIFSAAPLDLGMGAVNLNQTIHLPPDRWVLWVWGAGIGPAVLFWALFAVVLGLSLILGRLNLTPLRWYDWLLLGLGLVLSEIWSTLIVGGWLVAFGWRNRLDAGRMPWWRFNLLQVGLGCLTLIALLALIEAIRQGLLGYPEMWIRGQGSSAERLVWYQDRGGPILPRVGVLSVPLWVYRILMLSWGLWLAWRLLDWLRWGFMGFMRPAPWLERPKDEDLRLDLGKG